MFEMKLEAHNNPVSLRESLIPVAEAAEFSWLKPIIDCTLHEFVVVSLKDDPPNYLASGSYFSIHENIANGNDLVNRSLTMRNAIFDLESMAINAALGYQRELSLIDSDIELAKNRALSDSKSSSFLKFEDIENIFNHRKDVYLNNLNARVVLHNTVGSSFNYGEQISLMRKIYADNIKRIVSLCSSINMGFKILYAGGPELGVNYENQEFLENLIWDFRYAIDIIEDNYAHEFTRRFFKGAFSKAASISALQYQAAIEQFFIDKSVKFNIDINELGGGGGQWNGISTRLRGINVVIALPDVSASAPTAVAENDRKSEMNNLWLKEAISIYRFPCLVRSPTVPSESDDVNPIDLTAIIPTYWGNSSAFNMVSLQHLLDRPVQGEWEISLPSALLRETFEEIKNKYILAGRQFSIEIVLCLEVALS